MFYCIAFIYVPASLFFYVFIFRRLRSSSSCKNFNNLHTVTLFLYWFQKYRGVYFGKNFIYFSQLSLLSTKLSPKEILNFNYDKKILSFSVGLWGFFIIPYSQRSSRLFAKHFLKDIKSLFTST